MNILLFTQVYPDEPGVKTFRTSSVCHYWAKEWISMGHNVVVVYSYPNYNYCFHLLAKLFPMYIAQFTNGTITNYTRNTTSYEKDGVKVIKIPMRKFMPKIRYSSTVIDNIVNSADCFLKDIDFSPDIILSHFDNPVLEIAGKMKDRLRIPFTFVLHGYPHDIKRLYPNSYQELISKVDVWGFRSQSIRKEFELTFGKLSESFIAYSGVPNKYIDNIGEHGGKIKGKVAYVGALMRRKYPEKIVEALVEKLKNNEINICFIGEGALSSTIKKQIKKYGIEDNISLLGHISREQVQQELDSSEYFIMVSRHETFGMVYLEAMAHGCITIASRNEGFDGIIVDGVNGFLCEAGNSEELKTIIDRIESMSKEEKKRIRHNAIKTAQNMTEKKMAEKYLTDVIDILNRKSL